MIDRDKEFIDRIKYVVELFSKEKFDEALLECNKVEELSLDHEEKSFLESIKKVIQATVLINQQDLDKALNLLESTYFELKKFRPNYKGMKVENLIDSINQAIIDIKSIGL
jgi:predicted negative regulator of RcsB-dependent stress response